jgi:hypothetical protein
MQGGTRTVAGAVAGTNTQMGLSPLLAQFHSRAARPHTQMGPEPNHYRETNLTSSLDSSSCSCL